MKPVDNIRRAFTQNIYEPLFWKFKRMPVLDQYRRFNKLQWDPKPQYHLRLKNNLAALLSHAFLKVPGYRQKISTQISRADIENDPLSVLAQFPVIDKKEIMEAPELYMCELNRGTFVNSSGGSTGTPVKIFQDNIYQTATLSATNLIYDWAGKFPGESYLKIWGAQRDITHDGKGMIFHLQNFMANRYIFNAFKLSPDDLYALDRIISGFRPKLIEGYADGLFEIASFFKENGIRPSHKPQALISSAGTLLAHMRETIQTVFNAPVFDRYGSREVGNMAAECNAHNGMHILGETTYLEVIDVNGNRLPPGLEGDIVVTNLWNYTMPLIRYRIGDCGIMNSNLCSCGRPYPLLKAVTGRSGSGFKLEDGSIVSPTFFIHFVGVVHNDGSILKFQITQKAYDHILIRLVVRPTFDLATWSNRDNLVRHIQKVMGQKCFVRFEIVDDIPKTPTGKHLYTVREMTDGSNR